MNTSTKSNLTSIVGYLLLLAALLGLLFQGEILATGPLGWTLQVLAVLLMIWARITFGARSFHLSASPTEGGLVTKGPYAFIRHPIYAAVLLFVWTAVISNISLVNIGCGVVACIGAMLRIISEERLVAERYPEYAEYAARTKRLVPYIL